MTLCSCESVENIADMVAVAHFILSVQLFSQRLLDTKAFARLVRCNSFLASRTELCFSQEPCS